MKKIESDILDNNKPFIKTLLRPMNEIQLKDQTVIKSAFHFIRGHLKCFVELPKL